MAEEMTTGLFFAGLAVLAVGGILSGWFPHRVQTAIFSALCVAGGGLTLSSGVTAMTRPDFVEIHWALEFPLGDVLLRFDPLAGFFITVFSLVFPIIAFHSRSYVGRDPERFHLGLYHFQFALLVVSMLLLVTTRNALVFLVLWELMSLSSFLLTASEPRNREAQSAAVFYLIAMHVAVLFLIAGFAYLIGRTGSLDFSDFGRVLDSDPLVRDVLFALFFVGFGTKAGFFPLHTWLPKAHPAAPAPVSALMSGLMIKTGIYGILRLISLVQDPGPAAAFTLLGVSLFTALYAILYAMGERDLKKQLAYSSLENMGLIGTGIAVGLLGQIYGNTLLLVWGYGGALLHLFHHALFKSTLFLLSGTVYSRMHTRDMEDMGGLAKRIPVTSALFLMGSIALCGLPPLAGFASEFALFFSLLQGIETSAQLFFILICALALLSLVGAFAVIAFTKLLGVVFLGVNRSSAPGQQAADETERPGEVLGPALMSGLILFAGAFPQFVMAALAPAVAVLTTAEISSPLSAMLGTLSRLSAAILVFEGVLIAVMLLRWSLKRKKKTDRFKTWDCAYEAPRPRMQYTASSYTLQAEGLGKHLLAARSVVQKPEGLFPGPSSVKRKSFDFVEIFIRVVLSGLVERFFRLVTHIQSNTHQTYVVYAILFIVFNFTWILVGR